MNWQKYYDQLEDLDKKISQLRRELWIENVFSVKDSIKKLDNLEDRVFRLEHPNVLHWGEYRSGSFPDEIFQLRRRCQDLEKALAEKTEQPRAPIISWRSFSGSGEKGGSE
jgi:hypothetical protein